MSDRNGNGNRSLSLREARELTPAVNPVEAMRKQLALALFDGVKEKDVLDVATKLKEMALAGDHKAMQMFFKLMLPDAKASPAPVDPSGGLQAMARAIQNLADQVGVQREYDLKASEHRAMVEASGGNGDED
jgi:hypothetical protein